MPLSVLHLAKLMNRVQGLASNLVKDVESPQPLERDPEMNIPTLWPTLKERLCAHPP
jgi:hypothetical protein